VSRRVLSDAEIDTALVGLDWTREGNELVKTMTLGDFQAAVDWVNRVASLSESLDHHPDILIRWTVVTLRVSTHSVGAITDLDVELARAVDGLG
jgi:4a-hydroxytetrahydrobiopterin dehydratase